MADLKPLRLELDRREDALLHVHGNLDRYDDWHEARNQEGDFWSAETYQLFVADTLDAFHAAKSAYVAALEQRDAVRRRTAEASRAIVSASERVSLEMAASRAAKRCLNLNACYPFITTERQCLDAESAYELARDLVTIKAQKYREQEAERRSDKRAGIIRHRASRVYHRT